MDAAVRKLIHRTSAWTAGVGVVLSPIPLLDELALFPIYNVLSVRIARAHALSLREMPWRPILKSTTAGLMARAAVNVTVALVPGVSAIGSAASAVALTEILGTYIDAACADPAAASSLTIKDVFGRLKAAVFKKRDVATSAA
jgi:uncharacterized protein (DUF697 family)